MVNGTNLIPTKQIERASNRKPIRITEYNYRSKPPLYTSSPSVVSSAASDRPAGRPPSPDCPSIGSLSIFFRSFFDAETSDMPAKKVTQSTQSRTRSANWTDALDSILLRLLKEQQQLGNCVSGQVKKEAWEHIVPSFNQRGRVNLAKCHLKNRFKVLKVAFALYSSLASRSGWSWDYARNLPKPESPSDWETVLSENPKYAKCKDRPFYAYRDIEMIYGKNIVTGIHDTAMIMDDDGSEDDASPGLPSDNYASNLTGLNLNNGASSSKVPLLIRAADLSSDFPSVSPVQHRPISSSPNLLNPEATFNEYPMEDRETHLRKRQRCNSSAPCRCKMSASNEAKILSEFADIGRQCLEIARELLNRDPVARPKVYSLEECIEKLNGLNDLSHEAMLAALEAFKDRDNRIIFISLNGSLLSAWIDRQIILQSESRTNIDK